MDRGHVKAALEIEAMIVSEWYYCYRLDRPAVHCLGYFVMITTAPLGAANYPQRYD